MDGAAVIHRTQRSRVALGEILGIKAFDTEKLRGAGGSGGIVGDEARVVADSVEAGACACGTAGPGHGHSHSTVGAADSGRSSVQLITSADHQHDAGIHTVVLRTPHSLDGDAFASWVGGLLWEPARLAEEAGYPAGALPPAVYRGKGVLAVAAADGGGTPVKTIFQSVYEQFDVGPATGAAAAWAAGEAPTTTIVLIGRGLRADRLLGHLEAGCRARASASAAGSVGSGEGRGH
jgi:G3E family GTPase